MEAEKKQTDPIIPTTSLEAFDVFFNAYSVDEVKEKFWNLFRILVTSPTRDQTMLPDEDIALFFDQLNDLVSAAHELHRSNRVSKTNLKEAASHD